MAIIHAHYNDPSTHVHAFLVEVTATKGGRKWINPSFLRIIRTDDETALKIARNKVTRFYNAKGIEFVCEVEVDTRNQGERSNYARTLAALKKDVSTTIPNSSIGPIGTVSRDEAVAILQAAVIKDVLDAATADEQATSSSNATHNL